MAGRQQTFDLIPTSLVRSTGPRPPMTSKAAKKAYLKAQGPRMSRAEQRRLEAEERARQKEEYEKERNARKAKAARERKAQKEQAQREARRKMGLPEPSKFVRPSQPTISRFVVAGNKRSWQETETVAEESDGTICEHQDEDYPLAKRVSGEDVSEEEYGDFPSLSQYDLPRLFDNLDTPRKLLKEDEQSSQELPQRKLGGDKEENAFNNEQIIDEMIAAQLLSEVAEASSRRDGVSPARTLSNRSDNTPVFVDEEDIDCGHITNNKETRSQAENRPALADRPSNFLPPVKVAKTISFVPTPPKPSRSFLPAEEANDPPSATQIFLENHLDDFFPSPSQEIRELLDDANELPSYTQISRELNPRQSAIKEDPVMGMFSSQDFVLSSQDLLEITTLSRDPPSRDGEAVPIRAQAPSKTKGRFFEEREEDLLHAAIHESKLVAERERKQRELLKKPSGPATRTLQRVQSAATDYGDEEFSSFEKELLALF